MFYTHYLRLLQLCGGVTLIIGSIFVANRNLLGLLLCVGVLVWVAHRHRCPKCRQILHVCRYTETKYCNHCGCDLEFETFDGWKK